MQIMLLKPQWLIRIEKGTLNSEDKIACCYN